MADQSCSSSSKHKNRYDLSILRLLGQKSPDSIPSQKSLVLIFFQVKRLKIMKILNASYCITSFPMWRKTPSCRKYEGYFDFKQLKIYAHVNIYYNSI